MIKRAWCWAAIGALLVAYTSTDGAERPLAETIRAAAEAVRPAVVGIEVKGRKQAGAQEFPNWPFGRIRPDGPRQWRFEWHWPPREGQPQPPIVPFGGDDMPFVQVFPPQPSLGIGTGLILQVEGDRGLVAAPQALVAGAETIFVKLSDGRQLAAKLLGTDKVSGLGCLEVRDQKLVAPKFAKPDDVQVGDWVIAVGGPESGGAVTLGIISAKGRPGEGEMAGTRLLAADITIAEGMAGGPLVNLNGEVVGITLPSPLRGRPGRQLAAAVPVDTSQSTIRSLAREGKVRRGWLGVVLKPLDPEALAALKIDAGVQIADVLPGQPAARAGVQAGDVALELDGRKVGDIETFRGLVSAKAPGSRITLKVLRGGKEMRLEVTLGEQDVDEAGRPGPAAPPQGGEKLGLGLSVQPLTPELANEMGFAGDAGLLVTDVAEGSPAAKARPNPIARGELIKELARKPVTTVAEAKAALEEARKANEKTVLVLVRSKEGARYVVVDLAD